MEAFHRFKFSNDWINVQARQKWAELSTILLTSVRFVFRASDIVYHGDHIVSSLRWIGEIR